MRRYRICLLDSDGRISQSFHMPFKDDVHALEDCEDVAPKCWVEIWDESRLVARIKPGNAPLNAQDHYSL